MNNIIYFLTIYKLLFINHLNLRKVKKRFVKSRTKKD